MLNVHYFSDGEEEIFDCHDITPTAENYFKTNNIKVSLEELNPVGIIVYGCPYTDTSEESEVVVFAGGRDCMETMDELMIECIAAKFGE